MSTRNLDKLFDPKSIAVIGASNKKGSVGYILLRNLIGAEYEGIVYPVNVSAQSVQGIQAYASISQVPRKIDLAIIAVPAKAVLETMRECGEAGVAGAVIVSTPQDLALIDARRGIAMFRRVEVPILGLVENMSTFICPHCGGRSDIFGHGGARDEATRLGIPFLGEVPLAMSIRETSDAGLPVVATAPDGPHAAAYRAIARSVWDTLSGGGRRVAPRIVIE